MQQSTWRDLKLSLERPYKNDNGEPIPTLLDITPEGEFIYESYDPPSKALGENLKRVFLERGLDFFDRIRDSGKSYHDELPQARSDNVQPVAEGDEESSSKIMTPEELLKMRMELAQELRYVRGHSTRMVVSVIQSLMPPAPASSTSEPKPPPKLSTTIVTKPPPISSIKAFNAQLTISSKDLALRNAADVFKAAADGMDRSRVKGEKYWVDALKIRRANWGLIPAPLPFGAPTGKGADRTSKDFLISFGLEESLPMFKRRAVGRMPTIADAPDAGILVFPQLSHLRLCVSLSFTDITTGNPVFAQNILDEADYSTIDGSLRTAQQEVIEQEIFSFLLKEASNLPTATARVSERLIVLDAAHGMSLKFELVNAHTVSSIRGNRSTEDPFVVGKCDLIFYALHVLLIRAHGHLKRRRLGNTGTTTSSQGSQTETSLLQPILDMLQYEAFCLRLKAEVDAAVGALRHAGVATTFRCDPVGDTGVNLLKFLSDDQYKKLGGDMVLRIQDQSVNSIFRATIRFIKPVSRHTLRMTMTSPAAMTVHLAQATIAIHTIPQFGRLLADELERCLLLQICELGDRLCGSANATWFVDFGRCVGKWEGCAL
ncbi:hypothetical protein PLEOSDRAFT_1039855 [Pleurotus ostreatus PC15]|uniref:Mediator of RNA polymerase II transcription subunit 17 n=1 Tax=Pleurotus ostreatus (strain PC15) TaxID=1137138 RepID=A0A067NQY7_PLEO1|nr:hypothetical protein PLEOSDRAFT_1039855 [Pleurotus ostreatus PC15]